MKIAHYFLQGEVDHNGLPQWLAEHTGLYGDDPDVGKLVIWINSGGGDVLAAIEAINLMKSSDIPVVTVINGAAESAALLIAASGHLRLAYYNSWGMAHHFSTSAEGSYHDIADMVKHNELLHDAMVGILESGSGLMEDEVEDMLLSRGSRWYGAKQLQELGLIDEVIEDHKQLKKMLGTTKIGFN